MRGSSIKHTQGQVHTDSPDMAVGGVKPSIGCTDLMIMVRTLAKDWAGVLVAAMLL